MILDGNSCERPEIEYPCQWGYKVIGKDKKKLEMAIFDVLGTKPYNIKGGNSSSKGKFHSLTMECLVGSEVERNAIFQAFQNHDDVKMVI